MTDPGHDRICTEAEVQRLVHRFYERVRADAVLGPIFSRAIDDWPSHLDKLVDFWSGLLRGTGRFEGAPMTRHAELPHLSPALFQRWLGLFEETLQEMGNPALHAKAMAMARRIAERLWLGYQRTNSSQP